MRLEHNGAKTNTSRRLKGFREPASPVLGSLRYKEARMLKSSQPRLRGQRGFVLVICLILLLLLALIGIASITSSTSDVKVSGNEIKQMGAFYAAESGLERAANAIAGSYQTGGTPPDPLPSGSADEGNYHYDYSTADDGPAV